MDNKKISVAAAALCLFSFMGMNTVFADNMNAVYAEDSAAAADTITLNCIGEKYTLQLGGTTEIPTWYSDNEAVVTVTPTGDLSAEITAAGKGTASVYAVFSGQILRFDVTVLRENADEQIINEIGTITLTNAQSSASANLSGVDNSAAEWSSSNTNVATVDGSGNIKAVGKGECVVSAVYGNYKYIINIISQYSPDDSTEPAENYIGEMKLSDSEFSSKITFNAPEGMPVKFSSTDESVAVVSNDGIVTAKGEGTCRIYVEIGTSKNYVNVISTFTGKNQGSSSELGNILLTAENPSQKMSLTNLQPDAQVTWKSNDTSVAVVNQSGVIVAVSNGTCQVIASVGDKEYTLNVTVDLSDKDELPVTEIKGIGKTLTISGMSGSVKYTSSDTSVATVDEKGVVTSVGEGFVVITADSGDEISYLRIKVIKTGRIGDANCDGKITMADATAILQHIGNSEKYGLSDEGIINADVDGKSGITGEDSLAIQMFDAKLINSLPLVPKS